MARRARILRRVRLLAGIAAAAAALVACNLLAGFEDEYAVRSQNGEGGNPEGGPGDDGAVDGAKDGPSEGGVDAAPDGRFCEIYGDASDITFCWDFEGPQGPPRFGWDDFENMHGEAGVQDGIGVGGSRALRATVEDAGTSARVFLVKNGPGEFLSYRKHELSFSMAITKRTTLATCVLGSLGFKVGVVPKYAGVAVWGNSDALDISDTPGGMPKGASVAPGDAGTWHTGIVRFERDGGLSDYQLTIIVDSTTVESLPFNAGDGGPTQVAVGAFYSSEDNGGVETVIDNILLRQTP